MSKEQLWVSAHCFLQSVFPTVIFVVFVFIVYGSGCIKQHTDQSQMRIRFLHYQNNFMLYKVESLNKLEKQIKSSLNIGFLQEYVWPLNASICHRI